MDNMLAITSALYHTSPNPFRSPIIFVLVTPALQWMSIHESTSRMFSRRSPLVNAHTVDWLSSNIHVIGMIGLSCTSVTPVILSSTRVTAGMTNCHPCPRPSYYPLATAAMRDVVPVSLEDEVGGKLALLSSAFVLAVELDSELATPLSVSCFRFGNLQSLAR